MAPKKRGKHLTERLETSVDGELAAWVNEKAASEDSTPAAIVRTALRLYRDIQERHKSEGKLSV